MAPTVNPTDAPVVIATALMTPPSPVNPGQTVLVEHTSMYLHFLHTVFFLIADIN